MRAPPFSLAGERQRPGFLQFHRAAWSVSLRSWLCCSPCFLLPPVLAGQGGRSGGFSVACGIYSLSTPSPSLSLSPWVTESL